MSLDNEYVVALDADATEAAGHPVVAFIICTLGDWSEWVTTSEGGSGERRVLWSRNARVRAAEVDGFTLRTMTRDRLWADYPGAMNQWLCYINDNTSGWAGPMAEFLSREGL